MAKIPSELMLREIGRLYVETVTLRQALGDQQQETMRMGLEVDAMRMQNAELREVGLEQEANLVALNERLLGKKSV